MFWLQVEFLVQVALMPSSVTPAFFKKPKLHVAWTAVSYVTSVVFKVPFAIFNVGQIFSIKKRQQNH